MVTHILLHTPPWVWSLLAGLLALGFWQSRPRSVAPWQVLVMPLVLVVLSLLSSAAAFVALPWLALAWLKAAATGAALGRRLPAGARWDGERLHLAASWLPLAAVLVIFALRYGSGVALALHPEWAHQTLPLLVLTVATGGVGGLMAGRAIARWGVSRGPTMAADVQPA